MHSSDELNVTRTGVTDRTMSFDDAYRSYYGLALSTCRRKLWGFPYLVDDAVQAVFIILARKYSGLSERGDLSGWIHRTSVLTCMNLMRKETRRAGTERASLEGSAEQNENSDGIKGHDNLKAQIDEALDALPRRQREAVIKHYLNGASCRDLAGQLGSSEAAVKMLLLRARKRMHQILVKRGVVVSLAALTTLLEGEAAAGQSSVPDAVSEASETARGLADQVMREMGWLRTRKALTIAAGVLLVAGGLGGSLILSDLSDMSDMSDGLTQWRVATVTGAVEGLETGKLLYPGNVVRTGPGQEVELRSHAGERLLVREESKLALAEHPTSNIQPPTPKVGESGWRLEKGAVVAELKRPVWFETAHGVVETDEEGADFWLMVAESSNSFTRVDVTEGRVACRVSRVETGGSALPVEQGQAVCLGPGIEPKVMESDGFEFSPRFEGRLYRWAAAYYQAGRYALEDMPAAGWRVRKQLSARELEAQVRLPDGDSGHRVEVRGDSLHIVPGSDTVVVGVPIGEVGPARLVRVSYRVRLIGAGNKGRCRFRCLREGLFPVKVEGNRGGVVRVGKWISMTQTLARVGTVPLGAPMWERCEDVHGRMRYRTVGSPLSQTSGPWPYVEVMNETIELADVVIEEYAAPIAGLDVVKNQ